MRVPAAVALLVGLVLVVPLAPVLADYHYRHPWKPKPWTDWRPTVKARPGRDLRVRPFFHWPRPCYLDLAPVVFPGPPPPLRPVFADPSNPLAHGTGPATVTTSTPLTEAPPAGAGR